MQLGELVLSPNHRNCIKRDHTEGSPHHELLQIPLQSLLQKSLKHRTQQTKGTQLIHAPFVEIVILMINVENLALSKCDVKRYGKSNFVFDVFGRVILSRIAILIVHVHIVEVVTTELYVPTQ